MAMTSLIRTNCKLPRVACSLDPSTPTSSVSKQDVVVVVVGGGIAGLDVSLSLHKLGVDSIVIEQGGALRTGGTSLNLFKNGWRVLDSLGVGDEVRNNFLPIQGIVMKSDNETELRSFSFDQEAPGQEVRAVERRILLETLANKLPPNTISYSSRIKSVNAQGSEETMLELEDGCQILAKVYWFVCFNSNSPGAISKGQEAINQAIREYSEERWYRVFPLTVQASLVGSLVQWDNPLVCALRNYVFIPKLVRLGPLTLSVS